MKQLRPMLCGGVIGVMFGLVYLCLHPVLPWVQIPMVDAVVQSIYGAVAPALTSVLFPGQDPLIGLVFFLPVMLLVSASAGVLVGLVYALLRRLSVHSAAR